MRAGDDASNLVLEKGHVAYITTGGHVPAGADAVVQIENTLPLPDGPNGQKRVKIVKAPNKPGEDIRPVVLYFHFPFFLYFW